MNDNDLDPKGLIKDSYLIEGISASECRSIFLDWALSSLPQPDIKEQISGLLQKYASNAPLHPMTQILKDALQHPPKNKRRGERRLRVG